MSRSDFLVPIFGGAGNQMFQVAHALTIGRKFEMQPTFVQMTNRGTTERNWEVGVFGIYPSDISPAKTAKLRLRISTARELQKLVKNPVFGVVFDKGVGAATEMDSPPRVLYGYWQSKSFFESNEDGVRRQFRFPDLGNDKISTEIKKNPRSVAIHIRRGDYINDPDARERHLTCDTRWYEKSWEFVRLKLEGCHAFVFSDDPAWVKNNLRFEGSTTFVESAPDEEPWKDMARMSLCENFIISNSSYSWWAAYLSISRNKIVVAPKYWFNGVLSTEIDICPDEWLLR